MVPSTLKFLRELKKNNNKQWFDANRASYEKAKADFEQFIQAVLDIHCKKDPDMAGLVSKKCLFRINRDVRFSKNKAPYKLNLAASMDKGGKKSGLAGCYFHLEPGKSFVGGGLWQPAPETVKKVRQEIDYCFDEFKKIVTAKKFRATFGDLYDKEDVKLSKIPHGFEKDNPAGEYLKFKSWMALTDISDSELTSKDIVKKTVRILETIQPFIKFLNRGIEDKNE